MATEKELNQLRAENEALRARLQQETRVIHPDIEPKFYNGSAVMYKGELHRVLRRGITWDGEVTYDLSPVQMMSVDKIENNEFGFPTRIQIEALGSHYSREGESVWEVPEAELEPMDDEQISSGKGDVAGVSHDPAVLSESSVMAYGSPPEQ